MFELNIMMTHFLILRVHLRFSDAIFMCNAIDDNMCLFFKICPLLVVAENSLASL